MTPYELTSTPQGWATLAGLVALGVAVLAVQAVVVARTAHLRRPQQETP